MFCTCKKMRRAGKVLGGRIMGYWLRDYGTGGIALGLFLPMLSFLNSRKAAAARLLPVMQRWLGPENNA